MENVYCSDETWRALECSKPKKLNLGSAASESYSGPFGSGISSMGPEAAILFLFKKKSFGEEASVRSQFGYIVRARPLTMTALIHASGPPGRHGSSTPNVIESEKFPSNPNINVIIDSSCSKNSLIISALGGGFSPKSIADGLSLNISEAQSDIFRKKASVTGESIVLLAFSCMFLLKSLSLKLGDKSS